MLIGRADVEELASGGVRMERLDTPSVRFEDAELLQVICEIETAEVEDLLPPSLHPTIPGIVNWQVMQCPDSPWGPFRMALTRIEARSGLRPRAFVLSGRIDNEEAQAELAAGWGYPLHAGEIEFRRGYDAVSASVEEGGLPLLEIGLRDPEPLSPGDLQYVSDCHLAHTPRGIRLVQVDPEREVKRADRGIPEVHHFEASEWGDERVCPIYPVSASIVTADITLPKLRYLCVPDQMAFTGTEKL